MSEQNLSDKFFNSEESGVPVPPVEQGWSAMQHMLDKAMPVHMPSSPTAPKPTPKPGVSAVIKGLVKGALISGTAVTVSVSSWWLYKQYQQTKEPHPALVQPAVDRPVADSIQLTRDSSYSAIPSSLADSSHLTDELFTVNPAQDSEQRTMPDHKAQSSNITEGQSQMATGAGRRAQVAQGTPDSKNDQAASTPGKQDAHIVKGQSGTATGAGRHAQLAQGTPDSKDDRTASDGTLKTNKTTGTEAAFGRNAASQQASTHIKKQSAGNTGRLSRPITQVPVTASNGSRQTPAGLSSHQPPASNDPVIPSTGQRTPRAGSPQLPGAGKPPAASGANGDAKQSAFAGNDSRNKPAKPKTMGSIDDGQTTDIPVQKDTRQSAFAADYSRKKAAKPKVTATSNDALTTDRPAQKDTRQPAFAAEYPRKKAAKPKVTASSDDAPATDIPAQKDHLLPSDNNRTTSDPSVPATANRWLLEPVKQPDQSRNIRLLHNNKDRNTIPTAAVTRHKRDIRSAWNIYGQLPLAIPLEGSTYYFTGPDGKKQYWRLLIPSLRIERAIGQVALSVDVMPSINTILPSNEHHSRRAGSSFPQYDTIRYVVKQYGTGLTLQAHYFLTSHLKISAGAQLSLLGKATVSQTLADTLNKREPILLRAATKPETDSLVRSRISGLFEVYYEFGKWQTGVRTIIPFTNTGLQKNWPVKTPVQVELLFRRRLFTR
ncbi:hypothetical protein SAMN05428949_0895 [Chitinophaga sp. YR627]|uniref:hypothetical protein n=1 Tax=Chitinophaga sp. YR627 TaxID=1881041 RepID=UPI0008E1B634|nr:hypothetical protein [Chitinophaga sp. YR627]SFM81609.1 hypothetical protein SAMN05428949_0895 [Chitinophaga sp. YR627]